MAMLRSVVKRSARCRWLSLAPFLPLAAFLFFSSSPAMAQPATLRVGHFPNITHGQALVAHHLTRQGKGWFEERLPGVKIEWFVYNAGPSAIEAIFAKSIDLTYVGPNPALNGYVKSRGEEVRIVAGAAEGGSALVVQQQDSALNAAADFRGKKIATPQLGNTQDVAARAWLTAGGLRITLTGGDAMVVPTANPDQLLLFKQKQVDAVWTVEPWVSRLEMEAEGRILLEDSAAITTLLVVRADVLAAERKLVRKFVAAHLELTEWIKNNPDEAQRIAREELLAETRTQMPEELVARAWKRIVLTGDVSPDTLAALVAAAQSAGFLRGAPDLTRLIEKP
jgi:NitT/TauT family transport system substrate-binding protein